MGNFSEKQCERFYRDIKARETRYQGGWNVNMMADSSWSMKRDIPDVIHNTFTPRRKRYHSES